MYLKEYVTLEQAQAALDSYFRFYNTRRPHQALAYQTPEQVQFELARPRPMDMMDNCALRLRNGYALRAQLPTYPQAQPQPSVAV